MNLEEEIKKRVNPISITLIILSIAMGIVLVYFDITHWNLSVVSPMIRFSAIGCIILLFFEASIRIADQ